MRHDDFTEYPLGSETVFDGALLRVLRDRVRLPDGSTATREYVLHPGAAIVLPVHADGRVVLVRQYRYPVRRELIEFPAGKLDAGEPALETARRELLEETGYRAGRLEWAFSVLPCIGYSNEHIDYFLAEDLVHEGHSGEDGEFLASFDLPLDELLAAIDRGEIPDTKTQVGAYWLDRRRRRG